MCRLLKALMHQVCALRLSVALCALRLLVALCALRLSVALHIRCKQAL